MGSIVPRLLAPIHTAPTTLHQHILLYPIIQSQSIPEPESLSLNRPASHHTDMPSHSSIFQPQTLFLREHQSSIMCCRIPYVYVCGHIHLVVVKKCRAAFRRRRETLCLMVMNLVEVKVYQPCSDCQTKAQNEGWVCCLCTRFAGPWHNQGSLECLNTQACCEHTYCGNCSFFEQVSGVCFGVVLGFNRTNGGSFYSIQES
jgi:hypothetical protein